MTVSACWYEGGLRFACQGSSCCCRAQEIDTYVFLSIEDRRLLAAFLGIPTASFTRRYCARTDGDIHLRHPERDCVFLYKGRCQVYEARPEQCRTWPFWPENMSERVWRDEVAPFCAGVGKGRRYTREEINKLLGR